MQYSTPTTTEDSKKDERLKVGVSSHGKKKSVLKKMVKTCVDGKGGPGPVGYGKLASFKMPSAATSSVGVKPTLKLKLKGIKKVSSIPSSLKSLSKKMKFGKGVKGMKKSSLKDVLNKL